jgi:hypothetical protein
MVWLAVMFAGTVGGAIGWWMGSFGGIMLEFILSLVGTAVAMYYTRKWLKDYLG